MKAFATLLKTELKLAVRSMDMVLFAVLMPVAVLVVVGLIYCGENAESGMVEMTFGAFLSIGICAIGLMGLPLGLAEYRHRKVLKRLQVTPAHPALLLSVQLIAQAAVSIVSAALVIAGTARDIKRAGMIDSLLYFPMLIFSGTTVPFPVFPEWVQRAAVILPLRHGIDLPTAASRGMPLGPLWPQIGLLLVIAIAGVILALTTFRWDMD